jgi:hypothetical protein
VSDEATRGAELRLVTDGRDVDPRIGGLSGAGAGQRAAPEGPDRAMPGAGEPVWDRVPSQPIDDTPTYYDQPVVKAPPWGPAVPAYIVLGGLSGASAALAAATQGTVAAHRLTVSARWLAAASGSAGAVLLLTDLGRPSRFLNMFRVARPTSPMSVGVYLLSSSVGTSAAAAVIGGRWRRLGRLAGTVAGITGVPLTGYTGVLLATSALPGWNVGMATLPPLFMASAVATAGSALTAVPMPDGSRTTVDAYRIGGQLAELAAEAVHERAVAVHPRIAAAYRSDRTWRAGRWLTVASLVAGLVPALRRRTLGRLVIALLGVAGSSATKAGVFSAGMATAADPRATTEQQRTSAT